MRPEKLIFSKDGEEEDNPQTLNEADEESSDEESDSDSGSEEEEGTAAVPPKKPKLNPPRKEEGPEPGEDDSEKKKTPIASKIFSQEDEIALLKGLALFWANGRNNRWAEFHLFIRDNLPHQFTRTQVSEKIRRLKAKFENNHKRARAREGCLDSSNPHESILFELSKTLWGEDKRAGNMHDEEKKTPVRTDDRSIAGKTRKRVRDKDDEEKKTPKKQKQAMEIGKEEFESAYPLLSASFDVFGCPKIAKEKCYLIGREKAEELEQKWRELKAEELGLELKRIDLIRRDLQHHLSS